MLKSLDIFFILFHSILIVFNLFGWIWKPTRKANLITLLLTGSSWFILGIFYGIGYCPLTDWHWGILRKLGVENIPNSYIQYLIIRIFHIKTDPNIVDIITASGYFAALICSIIVNFKTQLSHIAKSIFYTTILILLVGCEENINVIVQGKDVPIAYCVLDINDSIHYLRITKSVIAEEDAYDLINNPDNLNYSYVEAYLNEFVNDNYVQTFSFEPSDIVEKDSGLFPFVPHSIYQLFAHLNPKAKYELHINIPDIDTLVANTLLVQPFRINDVRIIYISETQPFFIRWTSPVNGKYYEIKMQYHLLRNYGTEIKQETVELILGTSTSFNTLGGEQISFEFPVSNYQYIKEEYLMDTLVHTQLEQIDLIFTAATEELLIYRNSARSINSGMIERQVFTNIQNGKGLFTSRIIKKFENVQIIIDSGE